MKPNIGRADKGVRILASIIMTGLYIFGIVTGWLGYLLLISSFTLLITVVLNFCPMCAIFGVNTCEVERR
jgi:hypothetical protein